MSELDKSVLIENLEQRFRYYLLKQRTTRYGDSHYYKGKKECVEELSKDIHYNDGVNDGYYERSANEIAEEVKYKEICPRCQNYGDLKKVDDDLKIKTRRTFIHEEMCENCIDMAGRVRDDHAVRKVIYECLHRDGPSAKQWGLEEIARLMGFSLKEEHIDKVLGDKYGEHETGTF